MSVWNFAFLALIGALKLETGSFIDSQISSKYIFQNISDHILQVILRNCHWKVWRSPVTIFISDDLAWIRWNRFAWKIFLSEVHIHFQICLCTRVCTRPHQICAFHVLVWNAPIWDLHTEGKPPLPYGGGSNRKSWLIDMGWATGAICCHHSSSSIIGPTVSSFFAALPWVSGNPTCCFHQRDSREH